MGLTTQQCEDLKVDSSFVTHVPYPYTYTTTPEYNLVEVDGIGGSTCLGASNNSLTLAERLESLDVNGQDAVVVMLGINDVNLGGRTAQETAACLADAWEVIADELNATPMAIKYPSIDASAVTWQGWGTTGAEARQNAIDLNAAIGAAANAFNQDRTVNRVQVINFSNAYSPAPGTYTTDGVHPTPAGALRLAQFFYWYLH